MLIQIFCWERKHLLRKSVISKLNQGHKNDFFYIISNAFFTSNIFNKSISIQLFMKKKNDFGNVYKIYSKKKQIYILGVYNYYIISIFIL